MALTEKQKHDLNNMNRAAQNVSLGDMLDKDSASIENATTEKAGLVKQVEAIEDSSGATDSALEIKFNALLAGLRKAGILAE